MLAAIVVLCAALSVWGLWDVFRLTPERPNAWWGLATGLPACLVVLGKRRWPNVSLAVGFAIWITDLLLIGTLGVLLMLLDLLWNATLRASLVQRKRLMISIVIVTVVMTIIGMARSGGDLQIGVVLLLSIGSALGVTYAAALAIAQANDLTELQKQARAEDAERAKRELALHTAEDRERMARELHDAVAGHVSAAALRAEAALVADADLETSRDALRAVRAASLDAHETLRGMIDVLRTGGEFTKTPSLAEVSALAQGARRAGLHVSVAVGDVCQLSDTVDEVAGHVVREGLANAVRHAAGGVVSLDIARDTDALVVRIASRDGEAALPGSGWGLHRLRELVTRAGGTLAASPVENGWLLLARIPVTS